MKSLLVTLAWVLGACGAPRVYAQIALPALETRVTDLTGTLTAAQQSALEEKLEAFEARKGTQIVVLILPTTQPEDIAQFGVRLLESWKVGRKGVDDGAALIIAKDDHVARIEVQYGLEGVLNDATSARIIDEAILPQFKQGDFAGGVNAGVDRILTVVDGEPLPAPDAAWKSRGSAQLPWPTLMIGLFVVGSFLRTFIGRFGAASVAGVGAAALIWWITSKIAFALLGFVGIFLLTLIFGLSGGAGRYGGAGRVFRDVGGGFGGGFGGGGGGGGFSGGGGMGGGGGASGRW